MMLLIKKTVLLSFALFFTTFLKAQIEVAHLTSKGFSSTGFGGFLNFAIPVSEGNFLTGETGVYSFKKDDDHVLLIPIIAGYRHTLNGSGSGFYAEPSAGYTIGATDIQQDIVIDGKYAEQKASGATAGIGTG